MYEAYVANVVDVDGWQKAGAIIAWLLNAQISGAPFKPEQWMQFRPTVDPQKQKQTDDDMEALIRGAYGG